LKYNLKYALDDPKVSEKDKNTIREAEKISKIISNSFYPYAFIDNFWSIRSYKRQFGKDEHLLMKSLMKGIFFISFRIFIVYEATNYLSMWYLKDKT
jgi:hypothetical protein